MKNQIIKINKEEILAGSEKYFRKMCGFSSDEQMEEANELRDQYEEFLLPQIIVSIGAGKEQEMVCTYAMCIGDLNRINNRNNTIYKNDDQNLDMLEQFYLDTWMTAILDSARDWLQNDLREFLSEKEEKPIFISEAFGPGFYGIGMDEIPKILEQVDGSQIGINWTGRALYPPKSNVGYYLAYDEEREWKSRDCRNCLSGHKNCIFCKNYIPFA